jgi:DNA-binding response OmpR family regulator
MKQKKILLVDDSPTILMMEKMILAKEPYALVVAKDGHEALAKARSERPDLILLDVVMPKMDGFQVLKTLRGEQATRTIPIIMVTTRGEASNIEGAYASGCTDYVTKPFDGFELISRIRNYLGD